MSGVYNRKLFQSPTARDQLRQAGGIMSSSPDLMLEALRSLSQQQSGQPEAMQPPPVMQQGLPPAPPPPTAPYAPPMAGQQQPMQPYAPPTEDQQQQPMMQQQQQPMMQQPMMQQPMMQQQPMQPPMQQPYADPYGDQQPASDMGMAPIGYEDGGSVLPTAMMAYNFMSSPEGLLQGAGNPALMAGSTLANLLMRNVRGPSKVVPVDITAPAGTVRDPSGPANSSPAEAISADIVAKAEDLATKVDTTAPEDIGKEIVNTAASKGIESSGDLKFDLASIYERMTGDASGYEKNIDSLNRGIIGAAIGAGTSARATENISNGLLVGLQAAKATEERRAGDEQAINAALLGASLKPGSDGTQARDYRSPTDAYQDAYQAIMGMSEYDLPTDADGAPVDRKTYATEQAQRIVLESYTPAQLRGTPFEGLSASPAAAPNAGTTAAPANSAIDETAVLEAARSAIASGAPVDTVKERLKTMGIDPGKL